MFSPAGLGTENRYSVPPSTGSAIRCAEEAWEAVLREHFKGERPTPRQCGQKVGEDPQGRPITLAMQLGIEAHRRALDCARKKLSALRPGGFSIEQRYRYDSNTGAISPISAEQVKLLLSQGLASELVGTLVPDVVLHNGKPIQVQDVYDFKFPCIFNAKEPPPWRDYSSGPYKDKNQGEIYNEAFKRAPARVAPGWGVRRD